MKPYPYDSSVKHHVLLAVAFGFWVFVFLFATKPLDVGELSRGEQLTFLPIYALIGMSAYLLVFPIQYLLLKLYAAKWSVFHEVIFLICMVLIGLSIAWCYYFYGVMDSDPNAYSFSFFATSIFTPAMITLIPPLFLGRFGLGKYSEKMRKDERIEIKGEGNYEGIRLLFSDLICIQSADNYVEVFFLDGGQLKRQLIRNKLTIIEESFPDLLKTHRSFLINPYHFVQWKRENRKLIVVLTQGMEVPVSKTYQTLVEEAVNSTTDM